MLFPLFAEGVGSLVQVHPAIVNSVVLTELLIQLCICIYIQIQDYITYIGITYSYSSLYISVPHYVNHLHLPSGHLPGELLRAGHGLARARVRRQRHGARGRLPHQPAPMLR